MNIDVIEKEVDMGTHTETFRIIKLRVEGGWIYKINGSVPVFVPMVPAVPTVFVGLHD